MPSLHEGPQQQQQQNVRLLQNVMMARRMYVQPPGLPVGHPSEPPAGGGEAEERQPRAAAEGGGLPGSDQPQQQQQQQLPPDDHHLEDFKNDVRTWIELDNSIRRLQAAVKERRAARKAMTSRILTFMDQNNIDDLTTREGILRYKVSYVRVPLSQQAIKERISAYFDGNRETAQALSGSVFGNRERKEKATLVRRPLPR
jgi:hypothetical protein